MRAARQLVFRLQSNSRRQSSEPAMPMGQKFSANTHKVILTLSRRTSLCVEGLRKTSGP